MLEEILIEPMTPLQVPRAAELERENFSEPWTEEGFLSALGQDEALFYAAMLSDRLVAYAGIYLAADEGEITNVSVALEYRRQGIGGKLLEAILTGAKIRGARQIFLEVRRSNVAAISLYRNYGFEPAGIRKAFYRKPREDALVMKYEVKPELTTITEG